jgi:purine-cytosine permease-like protein
VAATVVWTSVLFTVSFLFGAVAARILGKWLWIVVACLVLALLLLGRKNVRRLGAPNSR